MSVVRYRAQIDKDARHCANSENRHAMKRTPARNQNNATGTRLPQPLPWVQFTIRVPPLADTTVTPVISVVQVYPKFEFE